MNIHEGKGNEFHFSEVCERMMAIGSVQISDCIKYSKNHSR